MYFIEHEGELLNLKDAEAITLDIAKLRIVIHAGCHDTWEIKFKDEDTCKRKFELIRKMIRRNGELVSLDEV